MSFLAPECLHANLHLQGRCPELQISTCKANTWSPAHTMGGGGQGSLEQIAGPHSQGMSGISGQGTSALVHPLTQVESHTASYAGTPSDTHF